jgi:uncharacterized protein (TIGR03083 family)
MHWDDYLAAIRRNGDLLAAAVGRSLEPDVPTCPGWTVRDLLEHVAVVHRHKTVILRGRLQENPEPPQPPATGLLEWFRTGLDELLEALAATPPATPVFGWYPPDRTAGFWYRRMAHETLIHRVDAELPFGDPTPIDPALAVDGIDEVVRNYVGGSPAWGEFISGGDAARIECTDRPESWLLDFGRFTGTSPTTGTAYDLAAFTVTTVERAPDAVITGRAADIDLWLWGRLPQTALHVSGDAGIAARLRDICAEDMG